MKKLLIILFFLSLSCFAKEKVLRVGVSMGMPPMAYVENKEIVGVEIDLLKEFAKENNLKYKLVNLDFDNIIPAIREGLIDVAMATMSKTKARAEKVDFTETYASISQMPLVHKQNAMRYQSSLMLLNTIDNVCVIKGYTGEDFVKENFLYSKVTVADTTTSALDNILNKKAEVLVADSVLIMWLASHYKDEGLIALPIILRKEDLAWAVKKGNKELLEKLNNFINKIKKDNKLDEIIRQRIPYYDSNLYNRK
ncbi:MAG: transporter substrate-binding domain-containing protein [Opitutales bacterium]